MVASTLTFAEFLALSGIQWSHKAVSTSLVAAKESIGVLDTFFGSNDTGLRSPKIFVQPNVLLI